MKYKIILLQLFIIIFSSCSSPQKMLVKMKLYNKYGERFKVYNHDYVLVRNEYQFAASPVKNKDLIFGGSYLPGMKDFTDSYIHIYLDEQYSNIVKKEIEKYTKPVYVFTRLIFNGELYKYEEVDVKTLNFNDFFDKSTYIDCYMICYFFKVLTAQNKDELLKGVYEAIAPYKKHPYASVGLKLYFWDPKFLDSYSLDVFNYDKLTTNSPETENYDLQKKYIKQRVMLIFDTDRPYKDFDIDTIYNNVVKVKNGESEWYKVNLNRLAEEE